MADTTRRNHFVIEGELSDLNTFIKALNNHYHAGADMKEEETNRSYWSCKKAQVEAPQKYPVQILFRWFSKNKRKDIDNVAFGKKFILDGMVKAGVLQDDSRKFVCGFMDEFFIDAKCPRVEVTIYNMQGL